MQQSILRIDAMDEIARVKELRRLATETLHQDSSELQPFLDKVEVYLQAFDAWQQQVSSDPQFGKQLKDAGKAELRALLEEVQTLHGQVVTIAEDARGRVLSGLGDLHRRAHALRTYIDRYPARITIAGKREG